MPTCTAEIHVGDIGTLFTFPITDCDGVVDLTGLIAASIFFEKADKTIVEKVGSVSGDPTLGILKYVTIDGDLSIDGSWRAQAYVDLAGGEWYSEIEKFKVHKNLGVAT